MKNLITLILGLIIGALIMYFYCSKPKNEESGPITVTPPRGIITPAEAETLNNNWTELRKTVNDEVAKDSIDNRSAWYAIDDIRDYLDLVQENNNNVTGIRLYLGVNDDLSTGGKTTIFMIPTVPNPNIGRGTDPNNDDPNGVGLDRAHQGMPPGQGYPN